MTSQEYAQRILVTGGAGFIGSAVVRELVGAPSTRVINVDKLTYAGNMESLAEIVNANNHVFVHADICDREEIDRILTEYRPTAMMHLAAESHVDRSIHGPADFIQTNIVGTYSLLEAARAYWNSLNDTVAKQAFRFHHISTDEVYGDLEPNDRPFSESTAYAPSSPYSASKASSDHLVRAWHRTFGLPIVITNCSNNYGPFQFPEKLIPVMILNALDGKDLPVYGEGKNVRDWLFVQDHAAALIAVLKNGITGRTYNIGGRCEKTNLEVVTAICDLLDRIHPRATGSYSDQIRFVADRPGHDKRYAIDDSRISSELGWKPHETFESGLEKTVRWYLDNPDWVAHIRSGSYREWISKNYDDRSTAR